MKILTLYATRGGVTEQCAHFLAKQLQPPHSITVSNIKDSTPDPTQFDVVVLGSPICMGKIDKQIKAYIKKHNSSLSTLPTAVFLCCGFPRNFEEYIETQIPKNLRCQLGFHSFGGELKPNKRKGIDKLIVYLARNSIRTQDFEESDRDHHELPEILLENINLLADRIKALTIQ